MDITNYQLDAPETASVSLDIEKIFAIRFSATLLLTLFTAGYLWTLAISYPAMTLLPGLLFVTTISGHFIMATQLVKRLQTLDDNTKNKALVWVPFIGVAYALPAVMYAGNAVLHNNKPEL